MAAPRDVANYIDDVRDARNQLMIDYLKGVAGNAPSMFHGFLNSIAGGLGSVAALTEEGKKKRDGGVISSALGGPALRVVDFLRGAADPQARQAAKHVYDETMATTIPAIGDIAERGQHQFADWQERALNKLATSRAQTKEDPLGYEGSPLGAAALETAMALPFGGKGGARFTGEQYAQRIKEVGLNERTSVFNKWDKKAIDAEINELLASGKKLP